LPHRHLADCLTFAKDSSIPADNTQQVTAVACENLNIHSRKESIKMKKLTLISICFFLTLSMVCTGWAKPYDGKKILYIDSYHEGYEWSDGITAGVEQALEGTGAELKIVRMDTKRNGGDDFKKEAALKAKAEIEAFKPDVVIASDDNASKFLIAPYFKDSNIPFVFCGVNWDASGYGFPTKNVTGMIEVSPTLQLIDYLKPFAKGDRVGFLGPDILTARKEAENVKKTFGFELVEYYGVDYADYKKGFLELQDQVDILILDSTGGLYNDQAEDNKAFVEANTKIPTGSTYDFMAPYTLFSFAKVSEEQGAWASQTALKILDGASPDSIPVVKNQEGKLLINTRVAKALNVELSFDVLESADIVIE
jgi:ABC-type uncharacterized transport system substrate-binding protein